MIREELSRMIVSKKFKCLLKLLINENVEVENSEESEEEIECHKTLEVWE